MSFIFFIIDFSLYFISDTCCYLYYLYIYICSCICCNCYSFSFYADFYLTSFFAGLPNTSYFFYTFFIGRFAVSLEGLWLVAAVVAIFFFGTGSCSTFYFFGGDYFFGTITPLALYIFGTTFFSANPKLGFTPPLLY